MYVCVFIKSNILISKSYQLHSTSTTAQYQELVKTLRIHTTKKEKKEEVKTKRVDAINDTP